MSTRPVYDSSRRKLRWESRGWHPLAQKLLVNSRSDRREGHGPVGKMKLNPVSLNASEMMRLLHFCENLFILLPGLPFIYYVEALTFPGCQAETSTDHHLARIVKQWLMAVCLKFAPAIY